MDGAWYKQSSAVTHHFRRVVCSCAGRAKDSGRLVALPDQQLSQSVFPRNVWTSLRRCGHAWNVPYRVGRLRLLATTLAIILLLCCPSIGRTEISRHDSIEYARPTVGGAAAMSDSVSETTLSGSSFNGARWPDTFAWLIATDRVLGRLNRDDYSLAVEGTSTHVSLLLLSKTALGTHVGSAAAIGGLAALSSVSMTHGACTASARGLPAARDRSAGPAVESRKERRVL